MLSHLARTFRVVRSSALATRLNTSSIASTRLIDVTQRTWPTGVSPLRHVSSGSGGNDGDSDDQPIHPLGMTPDEFRQRGREMIDFIADFYERRLPSGELPVKSQVSPGYLAPRLPAEAPQKPESFDAIMRDVEEHIMPGMTHWQAPGFFAYYPANTSFPGMLGELLSSAFGVVGFLWIGSPACTELETITLDWLGKMMQLPEDFLSSGKGGGVIQGTASEATLVALLAARARYADVEPERLVMYSTDQAHSSVMKARAVAGLPKDSLRIVPATSKTDYAFDTEALEAAISEDKAAGRVPFFMVTTVGTTSSSAVDPLPVLGDIAQANDMWMHVDAAYAGSACLLPEHRHHLDGVEKADSFNFNCHKWMLTPFDCSPLYVKDRSLLIDALGFTPEYLRNRNSESGLVVDYKDWQIPLGRRFRSMKLWFVLRSYGVEGIQAHLRRGIAQAARFEQFIKDDKRARFELLAPRPFSLVCFRLKRDGASNEELNALNAELLEEVNSTGDSYIIHTDLAGVYTLRVAVGSVTTQDKDIDKVWEVLNTAADKLLAAQ